MDGLAASPGQRRPPLPTIADYFALVRSRISLIAVLSALGALIGLVLAVRQPPLYEARASIELPSVPTWVNFDAAAQPPQHTTIDSTAQLVFSTPVVERVAGATSLTKRQVTDGLSVSAYPLSRVLITSFRAPTTALAVAGADEAAAALIAQRKAVLEGNSFASADRLSTYLHRLLPEANRNGDYNPVSRRLQAEITQIDDVRAQAASDRARILDPAAPAESVRPHGELQVMTGALLGLLAGVAYTWWNPGRRRSGGLPAAAPY